MSDHLLIALGQLIWALATVNIIDKICDTMERIFIKPIDDAPSEPSVDQSEILEDLDSLKSKMNSVMLRLGFKMNE